MKDLVIFGAGGFGREVVLLVENINLHRPKTYRILGFVVDDAYFEPNTVINSIPVVGNFSWLVEHKDEVCCTIAIADPKTRENVFKRLDSYGIELETLISPDVYVDPTTKIGRGCYLGYRTLLGPNMIIGDGVFFNSDCMFGHDDVIGDFTTVLPRATISGSCTIGSGVMIGGAAYIVPGKKIGDRAVIAAGSVVFSNVKADTHVMGNPAKKIVL